MLFATMSVPTCPGITTATRTWGALVRRSSMSASVKPLHRELGRAVGGVRHARAQRRPEAVHAAGVDQHAVAAGDQQRQEGPGAVVDTPPVHRERALPVLPAVVDEAAAAADAGVAEDQVDVIAGMLGQQLVAEPQHLRLLGNVAGMAADPDGGRGAHPRQGRGLRHGIRVQVAGRDRASLCRQLADELTAHAGAAAGHHRELARERIHRPAPPLLQPISRSGPQAEQE
jgi:hypothetical protein